MLNRNYQVFTGTQLYNDFGITAVNDRNLEKDQLFTMLFIISPICVSGQQFVDAYSEIYGPFFQLTEAQMWCDNLNKLFQELRCEIGDKLLQRNNNE